MDHDGLAATIEERAAAFINKNKQETIKKLKDGLKDKMLQYEAIRRLRDGSKRVLYLQGGSPAAGPFSEYSGNFLNVGDG
jgi:hypothetical protein